MLSGQLSSANPDNLQGKLQGSPREFFWDSITKYVAGVIIALAAINSLLEFVQGSKLTCLSTTIPSNFTDKEFINVYCASSVPRGAYFSAFITVHAIIILIPNALWTNRYSGSFDYFFVQSRMVDRTRDYETGEYSLKNYTIARQLQKVFTNYKENWMFITYVLTLLIQLVLTLLGLLVVVFYFTSFKGTFLCPAHLEKDYMGLNGWPLNKQVTCVMKPLTFYAMIRFADLILLAILVLSYIWSLAWCTSSHSLVLGWNKVADFMFQTSIPSRYYRFDSTPLRGWSACLKLPLHGVLTFIPFVGTGPHIRTNLDFLLLKLVRTDSGLGNMIREMLILSRVNYLNDNDNRIVKLHRLQQERVELNGGGK